MKLSVFYDHILNAAAQRGLSVSDVLIRVRGMGYSMVELDYVNLNDEVFSLLRAADMGIASLYGFFRFNTEPQKEKISAHIETAVRYGVQRIMPIPGFFSGDTEKREEEFSRMLDGMKELTERAHQAGLTVTIEDFDSVGSPIRDSAGMNSFITRLPHLYATFDTGNFRLVGEDELSAFDNLKERIAHVHLKDRSLSTEFGAYTLTAMDGTKMHPCPVGTGFIPMERIFAALREIGYNGVLSVEHFSADDQLLCMEKSAQYVRRFFEFD